jgi:hypothetical protein
MYSQVPSGAMADAAPLQMKFKCSSSSRVRFDSKFLQILRIRGTVTPCTHKLTRSTTQWCDYNNLRKNFKRHIPGMNYCTNPFLTPSLLPWHVVSSAAHCAMRIISLWVHVTAKRLSNQIEPEMNSSIWILFVEEQHLPLHQRGLESTWICVI